MTLSDNLHFVLSITCRHGPQGGLIGRDQRKPNREKNSGGLTELMVRNHIPCLEENKQNGKCLTSL